MSNHNFSPSTTPLGVPAGQVLSVVEAARVLGCEKTTVYRLIWQGKLRVCANFARNRIPRAEIERFLEHTQTYDERVRGRPKTAKPRRTGRWAAWGPAVHPSPNAHKVFVSLSVFGGRPTGERLVRTIVPDDENIFPQTFIEIDENEWTGKTTNALRPGER